MVWEDRDEFVNLINKIMGLGRALGLLNPPGYAIHPAREAVATSHHPDGDIVQHFVTRGRDIIAAYEAILVAIGEFADMYRRLGTLKSARNWVEAQRRLIRVPLRAIQEELPKYERVLVYENQYRALRSAGAFMNSPLESEPSGLFPGVWKGTQEFGRTANIAGLFTRTAGLGLPEDVSVLVNTIETS